MSHLLREPWGHSKRCVSRLKPTVTPGGDIKISSFVKYVQFYQLLDLWMCTSELFELYDKLYNDIWGLHQCYLTNKYRISIWTWSSLRQNCFNIFFELIGLFLQLDFCRPDKNPMNSLPDLSVSSGIGIRVGRGDLKYYFVSK